MDVTTVVTAIAGGNKLLRVRVRGGCREGLRLGLGLGLGLSRRKAEPLFPYMLSKELVRVRAVDKLLHRRDFGRAPRWCEAEDGHVFVVVWRACVGGAV